MKESPQFFRLKSNKDTIVYKDGAWLCGVWGKYSAFLGGAPSGIMMKYEHYSDNVIPLTTEEVADLAQKSKKVREILGLATEVKP